MVIDYLILLLICLCFSRSWACNRGFNSWKLRLKWHQTKRAQNHQTLLLLKIDFWRWKKHSNSSARNFVGSKQIDYVLRNCLLANQYFKQRQVFILVEIMIAEKPRDDVNSQQIICKHKVMLKSETKAIISHWKGRLAVVKSWSSFAGCWCYWKIPNKCKN